MRDSRSLQSSFNHTSRQSRKSSKPMIFAEIVSQHIEEAAFLKLGSATVLKIKRADRRHLATAFRSSPLRSRWRVVCATGRHRQLLGFPSLTPEKEQWADLVCASDLTRICTLLWYLKRYIGVGSLFLTLGREEHVASSPVICLAPHERDTPILWRRSDFPARKAYPSV
jgi:hypothetical protein